jgi:hypothetical protein
VQTTESVGRERREKKAGVRIVVEAITSGQVKLLQFAINLDSRVLVPRKRLVEHEQD